MAALTSIALGGAAVLGGAAGAIAGATDKKTESERKIEIDDPGAFERQLQSAQQDFFARLQSFTDIGPGAQDIEAGVGAQRNLAATLAEMGRTGGLPGQEDFTTGQRFAATAFAPQQEALRQSFADQRTQFARQAALTGRSSTDPILANRLAEQQINQQALLSAQQNAAAQQLAFSLPGQRLAFQAQGADVLSGLANQAFANRQSLLGLGAQLSQNEFNKRLSTATQTTTNTEKGSAAQAILGGLSGAASGLSMGASLMGLGGGGLGSVNRSGSFAPDAALAGIGGIQSADPTAQFSMGTGFQRAPLRSVAPAPMSPTQSSTIDQLRRLLGT